MGCRPSAPPVDPCGPSTVERDGPTYDISVPADTIVIFDLGGNSFKADEDPFSDVYDRNGTYVRTLIGDRTGDTCVSNERQLAMSESFATCICSRRPTSRDPSDTDLFLAVVPSTARSPRQRQTLP